MRHMFESAGFRATNVFMEPAGPRLGGVRMGDPVVAAERDRLLGLIKTGSAKLAQVRQWIASRINQDPMLYNTFKERYIADNFWSYDDLVTKDDWAVQSIQQALYSEDPSSWDVSPDTVHYLEDWFAAVDIMYSGMQEYGGNPVAPKSYTSPTGVVSRPGTPGTATSVLNKPAPGQGLTTGQMVIGGAVIVGAGILLSSLL